jgi:uncharacterized integral membrane protein
MRKVTTIVPIIAVSMFLLLVVQNTRVVSVQFLFWQLQMSRIILLLLGALVGAIVGFYAARRL